MIVDRLVFRIKVGKLDEAIEIAKEAGRLSPMPGRIYSAAYGSANTIVFENEFKDQAELEKLWAQFMAMEEMAPVFTKWSELVEEHTTTELWNLVDY